MNSHLQMSTFPSSDEDDFKLDEWELYAKHGYPGDPDNFIDPTPGPEEEAHPAQIEMLSPHPHPSHQ